jgi:hypothetical protein
MRAADHSTEIRIRRRAILGSALVGSLGISLLEALILRYGVYYNDTVYNLYPIVVHSLMISFMTQLRPLEYLILLAANKLYLPLWLGVSLLCMVGATILAALACERLFERQLPSAGWWILGLANPLLFYPVAGPWVSQPVANLLFAGAMLAFISELHCLRGQPPLGWRADRVAACLSLVAAALFFTKENAVAAAFVIPAATAWVRLKERRLSPIFLFSLLLPIGAASCWMLLKIWLKFKFPHTMFPTGVGEGHYDLKLNPFTLGQNFITTLAFPITPLPSSFLGFEILRALWVAVALGSVTLFMWIILRESLRQPKIVLPLLVIAASCAPMILIHSAELYASMIAPFAVTIVLLFGLSKMPWLSLAYGLLLYAASLGNGIIFSLGPEFSLLGLRHLQYSMYTKEYQVHPICRIGTTAHIAWDGTAASDLFGYAGVKGRITCIR